MATVLSPEHCPRCGGRLEPSPPGWEPRAPLRCTGCGGPVFLDPKLAVATVVWHDGRVVLLRRAQRDSGHGLWILPGGFVDRGEELRAAARREVAEETGLVVEVGALLGVHSSPGDPVVVVTYVARSVGGALAPGPEALEVRLFAPDRLPRDELGFTSTGEALDETLRRAHGAAR